MQPQRDITTRREPPTTTARPGTVPAGSILLGAVNLAMIAGAAVANVAGVGGLAVAAGGTAAAAGAGAAAKRRRGRSGGHWRTINGRRVRIDGAGRSATGYGGLPGHRRLSGLGGARAEGLPSPSGRRPVRRGLSAAAGWLGLPSPARWRSTQPGLPVAGRGGPAGGAGARPASGPPAGGRPAPGRSGVRPAPQGDSRRAAPTAAGRRRLGGLTRQVSRVRAAWRRWGQPETARPAAVRPQPAGDPTRRKPSPRPRPATPPAARDAEIDLDLDDQPAKPDPGPATEPEKPPAAPPEPRTAPTDGTRRTTGGAMSQSPMLQMQEMADQMVAIATRWEPEGMLEVLDAYKHWPDVLHRAAEAWKIMHRKAQEQYPLKPVVVELVEAVHRHQQLTANSAEEIAPTAHALHRDQIEALEDKRYAMWDHRANRDRAAA